MSIYDDHTREQLLEEIKRLRELAAQNGTKCFRLATALRLARQYGISSSAFDGESSVLLADWVDAGMPAGIPWPTSPFAQQWLRSQGYSERHGKIGMRATMTLAPSEQTN